MLSQADDVNSRLRTARSNRATANDKYQALLVGPSAKRLLELIGNPSPIPHGSEVRCSCAVQGQGFPVVAMLSVRSQPSCLMRVIVASFHTCSLAAVGL